MNNQLELLLGVALVVSALDAKYFFKSINLTKEVPRTVIHGINFVNGSRNHPHCVRHTHPASNDHEPGMKCTLLYFLSSPDPRE